MFLQSLPLFTLEAGDTVAFNGELYSVDVMISQELLDALSAVGKIPSNVEAKGESQVSSEEDW